MREVFLDEASHRYYYLEDDKKIYVPGVTTINSVLDKPGLNNWKIKTTVGYIGAHLPQLRADDLTKEKALEIFRKAKEYADELAKEQADIGKRIHDLIHLHLLGEKVDLSIEDGKVQAGFIAFLSWLNEHEFKPIATEKVVYHPTLNYAGTLDTVGELDGKLTVLDWKSGSGIYLESYLQISAYVKAYEVMSGKQVEQAFIIHLGKTDGSFLPYEVKDIETPFSLFLACLTIYNGKKNIQKNIKEVKSANN